MFSNAARTCNRSRAAVGGGVAPVEFENASPPRTRHEAAVRFVVARPSTRRRRPRRPPTLTTPAPTTTVQSTAHSRHCGGRRLAGAGPASLPSAVGPGNLVMVFLWTGSAPCPMKICRISTEEACTATRGREGPPREGPPVGFFLVGRCRGVSGAGTAITLRRPMGWPAGPAPPPPRDWARGKRRGLRHVVWQSVNGKGRPRDERCCKQGLRRPCRRSPPPLGGGGCAGGRRPRLCQHPPSRCVAPPPKGGRPARSRF